MKKYASQIISLVVAVILLGTGANIISVVGICTCIVVIVQFIKQTGKTIPIPELIASLAGIQWIIGAYISYRTETSHFKYYMYVPEAEYMSITVPIYIAFCMGLLAFFRKHKTINVSALRHFFSDKTKIAYMLILAGIISTFLINLVPPALAFVFFLASNLKYIGVLIFLFSDQQKKWIYLIVIMLLLFLSSVTNGMFHDFVLWSIYLYLYIAIILKFSTTVKIWCIVIGIFFTVSLQSIKFDYRSIAWQDNAGNRVELFFDLLFDRIGDISYFEENENIDNINVRFNQGWIISAIYEHVPEFEPYAEGETINEAIRAAVVPRVLDKDKKMAGGRENFMRFTGLGMGEHTSMGTSVLGEAYANYGAFGACIFMFIWGFFLSFIYSKIITSNNPFVIVFVPLIFLQTIKAETEFVVVLNHLVKAGIFTFVVIWLIKKTMYKNDYTVLSKKDVGI